LFPDLRYAGIAYSWFDAAQLSAEDIEILKSMENIRAIDIYVDGLPSLDFLETFPYVSVRYTESAYLSDSYNLADASVLGRAFVESRLSGHIIEYVRVAEGQFVYELIVTDTNPVPGHEFLNCRETRLFISEMRNDEYHFLDGFEVPGRTQNATGGLILVDVDFDGHRDILVLLGSFGNQAAAMYACFIYDNGTYNYNASFSELMNPSLDVQNRRVLSTWRNHAASHCWAMYSYANGTFIETDRLTESGVWDEESPESMSFVWTYEDNRSINGVAQIQIYKAIDYTSDELVSMFFTEDSYWALFSSKWRTLHNQGSLLDWSIYGTGLDTQIAEIASR